MGASGRKEERAGEPGSELWALGLGQVYFIKALGSSSFKNRMGDFFLGLSLSPHLMSPEARAALIKGQLPPRTLFSWLGNGNRVSQQAVMVEGRPPFRPLPSIKGAVMAHRTLPRVCASRRC